MFFPIVAVFLLFVASQFKLSTANSSSLVEVVIPNGIVIGEQISVPNLPSVQVSRFLGIPYATPPVGSLRFHRPFPPKPWSSPLNATRSPDRCVQTYSYYVNKGHPQSEDCLYLNIWSPDVNITNEEELRPVVVWVHGGSLLMGHGTWKWYNASTLANMADAVIVTFNYRLGTLGFFYSDEVDGIKGNQGLWDQVAALRWVIENIRHFGGNPSQITLTGWSAGSWSVSTLLLSPSSRDLFQHAIMMSGGPMFGVVENDPQVMMQKQLIGIEAVSNCSTETKASSKNSDWKISAEMVECLQQLSPQTIIAVYYRSMRKRGIPYTVHEPLIVVDGHLLPSSPRHMLSNGDHKKNFSLLLSTVESEGAAGISFGTRDPRIKMESKSDLITLSQAQDLLHEVATASFTPTLVSKQVINRVYFNGIDATHDSQDLFRHRVGVAFGDYLITCPTIDFARSLAAGGRGGESVKVFQWYYTGRFENRTLEPCATWAGACHGDDLLLLFGWPFRQDFSSYSNRERDLSREVIQFFKSFIRTGIPGEDQRQWQSYFHSANQQTVVAPYYHLSNNPKSYQSFGLDLKQAECDLWNTYYY